MEILLAVDKFLQIALVRWFLLVSTVGLLIAGIAYKTRLGVAELQLKAAKGDIATYAAHIEHQNAAVLKAGQEYEQSKKKALAAQEKAAQSARLAEEWRKRALATPLTGSCDEMVRQVVESLR